MHYAEMVIERFLQHLRSFAVALGDNYTQRFHERRPHWLSENTWYFRLDFHGCRISAGFGGTISSRSAPDRQVHRAQVVTFHSAAAESQLCLQPLPVPCGRKKSASGLLQRASMPLQAGHCLFPTHPRFVPTVEGNLQT